MYGLWQAIVRIPVGLASDLSGKSKPFIIGGFLLAGAGSVIMGLGDNETALAVGRALTGLAAGTWVPLTVTFMRLFPSNQAVFASSLLTLSGSTGRLLATTANGFLNEWGGYQLAFFLAAGFALLAVVFVLAAKYEAPPKKKTSAEKLLRLATNRNLVLPTVISTVNMLGTWAVPFGFMPILAEELGAGHVAKGLLISLYVAALICGNLLNTLMVRNLKPVRLLYGSTLLFAAGIAGSALSPSLLVLFLAASGIGLANGISYPILMGLSVEKVDVSERTTAMGMHQSIYAIGMFAGPWLGGIISASIGIRNMFLGIAVFCFAAVYILLILLSRSGRPLSR